MPSIKDKLLIFLEDKKLSLQSIQAADFYSVSDGDTKQILLREGHSEQELKIFLDSLDFVCINDASYGTVWFDNGDLAEWEYYNWNMA